VKVYLKENPDVADELEAKIRQNYVKLMTPQAKVAARRQADSPAVTGLTTLNEDRKDNALKKASGCVLS
jgi:hypothetical protein